ncbi:MBL fold metallo-hydrolase [Aquisalibacillus elongatus]|uniref:Beta-lactamase superfamily II metal-dependent hydrolase n=1 Tax=Aquisalibacillus elongatus TaxID=485577 RepID=A0A3N5C8J9_9BACI|nr:MBL fold metallo-hydrolase [Aquisalibacillus elongatus]RPF55862.1 beta-lactamase superfamily II metal-dependent hydrolase [Aquisalibacillus elongatus]
MADLFIFMFILSFIASIIGLIKPTMIKMKSRKHVIKYILPTMIIAMLIGGALVEPAEDEASSNEPSQVESKEEHKEEQKTKNEESIPSKDERDDHKKVENETEKEDSDKEEETSVEQDNTDQNQASSENDKNEKQEKQNSSSEPNSNLEVHYINSGQADATLFDYSHEGEDYNVLIDSGDWNGQNVVHYLNNQDVQEIDLVIGTHNHADHIGQMDQVVNQFEVDEVWLTGNSASSQTFERVLTAIETSDTDYHEPRAGEEYEIGSLEVDVYHPASLTGDKNDDSISAKMTYGETSFFFSGDVEASGESKMVSRGGLSADILQLGHHGSSTSNSSSFLSAIDPEVAIYSAGSDNSYGHPHNEVINRVKNAEIDLYGTDVHGTVIVTTNGSDYSVATNQNGNITASQESNQTTTHDENQETNNQEDTSTEEQNTEEKDSTNTNQTCVDINSASKENLQKIIHIGDSRAEDLISLRPFDSVDSLTAINGIGPSRIDDIKSQGVACAK